MNDSLTTSELLALIRRAIENHECDAKTRLLLRVAERRIVKLQQDVEQLNSENLELFRHFWKEAK